MREAFCDASLRPAAVANFRDESRSASYPADVHQARITEGMGDGGDVLRGQKEGSVDQILRRADLGSGVLDFPVLLLRSPLISPS